MFSGWIYPVVQYWCWSVDPESEIPDEGWLRQLGFKDFAGSGVIHLVGGTSGLVGCILVGPRKTIKSEGHSKPLQALGGAIMLFGFLAMNSGSAVSLDKTLQF